MEWKRNSIAFAICIFVCLIRVAAMPVGAEPPFPEKTILGDSGEQKEFEKAPLQGKEADMNALRNRAKDLDYREKKVKTIVESKPEHPPELPLSFFAFKDMIYGVVVLTLIVLLAYLLLKTGKRRNPGIENNAMAGPSEWKEAMNMHAETMETELQLALAAGEYRLAVRFLYLKNLKKLIDGELVIPSPEKTNLQYRTELETAGLSDLFGKNTSVYEMVWYGEAMPDSRQYLQYEPLFRALSEKVRK